MRRIACLALTALALSACKSNQVAGQEPEAQDTANALPSDEQIVAVLLRTHSQNCNKIRVYDRHSFNSGPYPTPPAQVVNEYDGIRNRLSGAENITFISQDVNSRYARTGEPANITTQYMVSSAQNPNQADPFDINLSNQLDGQGHLMWAGYEISLCPSAPNSIDIIDHEVDSGSGKNAVIRYQVNYGASNALTMLGQWGDLSAEFLWVAARHNTVSPPRDGIATLHRNDTTGWTIERAVLQ